MSFQEIQNLNLDSIASILTYNINGIRAAIKKDLPSWIASTNSDIICLQEIKAKPEQFDTDVFRNFGYRSYIQALNGADWT